MGCTGGGGVNDGDDDGTPCTGDAECASVPCAMGEVPFCDVGAGQCDCQEDPDDAVRCDEPTGTITGVALDEQDPAEGIPMMRITASPEPSGPSVTVRSDGDGNFTLEVCAGATYAMSAETVVGDQRYMSTDSDDRVEVPDDAPVTYDIDARRGYFLDAMSASGDTITVSPGAVVSLDVDTRAWSREGCPACTYRIAVGIEGDFADWAEIGAGSYANNGDAPSVTVAMLSFDAPSTAGDYKLYALLYAGTATAEDAETFYEGEDGMRFPNADKFIELATLRVE